MWSLFAPIHMKSLPLFGPKIPFLSIFSLTYLYLPLFTYIWLYLGLITLIWAYLPTGARHLMAVYMYQIYDSLLTHAFLWRYNFRAIILAPSVVSYRSVCGETKDGAKIMAPKLRRQRNACFHRLSEICYMLSSNVERLCICP